jgi:competence protein ComEA
LGVIVVLVAINVFNFIRTEQLKKNAHWLIEEGNILLSLNEVSARELEDLPGIGPALAERIIEYRERTGRFSSLEELKNVKGIGERLYNKICPYIKL